MNDLEVLSKILTIALVVTFACALGGAFLPGTIGVWSGRACIVILIAAPVLRVTWLVVDWTKTRDVKFALLGCALLVVLATSGAIIFLR
jgi:hypothetical protein